MIYGVHQGLLGASKLQFLLDHICLIVQCLLGCLYEQHQQAFLAVMVLVERQLHWNLSCHKYISTRRLEHLVHEQQCLKIQNENVFKHKSIVAYSVS